MSEEDILYINEDYVNWKTTVLMLKNGYALSNCLQWYTDYDNYSPNEEDENGEIRINEFSFPLITISKAIKWLRKQHNLYIQINCNKSGHTFHASIYYIGSEKWKKINFKDPNLYNEPEEPYEIAIRYCLEILINENLD